MFLLPVVMCAIAVLVMGPPPPSSLRLASGAPDGPHYEAARALQAALHARGLALTVMATPGPAANLDLVAGDSRRADIAFVQGAVATPRQRSQLQSMGVLLYEPMWVFLKAGASVDSLAALKGRRLAIDTAAAGTRAVAEAVLATHGIDAGNTALLGLNAAQARAELVAGSIDAAIILAAAGTPAVTALLADPDLEVLGLANAGGVEKHVPYLSRVVLERGAIDLQADRPSRDVPLVAAGVALVARKDMHPALGYLLAEALDDVSRSAGLFHKAGELPIPRDPVFQMAAAARHYYRHGAPFLHRHLSFWVADFVERALTLVLPLVTVVLPLVFALTWLYRRLLHLHVRHLCVELWRLEEGSHRARAPQQAQALIEDCDRLAEEIRVRSASAAIADQVATLQWSVISVRALIEDRLARLHAERAHLSDVAGRSGSGVARDPASALQPRLTGDAP